LKELFERFDQNKDGILDKSEILVAMEPMMAKVKAKAFTWEASLDTDQGEFKAMIR
jgi:Ca2+-binding EF-hand superfamily protein